MDFKAKKESFELTRNIDKALNPLEKPLDYELSRNVILMTHHLRDGSDIWNIVQQMTRTPNRFSAWKFCCLLHRLFRDGHCDIVRVVQQQKSELQFMSDYWIREHTHFRYVGLPIVKYTQLLLFKLNFHQNYTFFDGDLHLNYPHKPELNESFQLASNILDYLDCILELFAEIIKDIRLQNLHVKSCQAQCRLTNIITLISECGVLYAHFVTVLKFLTEELPPTDVVGLSNRFCLTFDLLQKWFIYFRSLDWGFEIDSMPELPEAAPTFGIEFLLRETPMPSAPFENELD